MLNGSNVTPNLKWDGVGGVTDLFELLSRNVKRFRGGLVFKAHRRLFQSTLGLTVITKKKDLFDDVSDSDVARVVRCAAVPLRFGSRVVRWVGMKVRRYVGISLSGCSLSGCLGFSGWVWGCG